MSLNAGELKIEAGRAALAHVGDGMRLGIGSGSTSEAFIGLLGGAVADGLSVVGVPTSARTAALCEELKIPLTTLEEMPELDLTIDGADEVGPELALIKGGGGALLREKIVASASKNMIVIADAGKVVPTLGRFPLPVEVNAFGLKATMRAIEARARALDLTVDLALRERGGAPFVTDGGHLIVDASFGRIPDPRALANALNAIAGVVENGLFIDLAKTALIAGTDGVRTIEAT